VEPIRVLSIVFALFVFTPVPLLSRDAPPVVSTDWLEQNLENPALVVLDMRSAEQYKKGHIPGALHTSLNAWAPGKSGLSLELPSDEALQTLLGSLGIRSDSIVVVVHRGDTDFARADATRVAWTCVIAGVKTVSVLDGGHNKWSKENKAVTNVAAEPRASVYGGKVDRATVAFKDYVLRRIGKSVLLDTRAPEHYFGADSKHGHIKSAVSLPTPWAFAEGGVYKDMEELQRMAAEIIGNDKSKEVLVYCDVGGYASTWWFLLTQVLGYQNVKLYDGSMQEWLQDPGAPLTVHRGD